MSKNLTRKGLAFGALVALGTSLIAGAPAQAAGITGTSKVTLTSTAGGEVYNVLSGGANTFSLNSTVAQSLRGNASTGLKWLVSDSSETVVASSNDGDYDVSAYNSSHVSLVNANGVSGVLTLVEAAGETASRSVTVTAFYDDNNNGSLDNDEYASTQTVNFLATSSVSSSVVVTSPILGDTTVGGYIVTSPKLNSAQSTLPSVKYTKQGSATVYTDATVSNDEDNARFAFIAPTGAVIAGAYSVTPYVGTTAGTKSAFSVAAATAADGTANVAASANLKVSGNDTASVSANVRKDTKSVVAKFAFVNADGVAVGAGVPVRITFNDDGSDVTGVKINGTSVVDGERVVAVTDSNGLVTATVTTTSGAVGDYVGLSAKAENVTATVTGVVFEWIATELTAYDQNSINSNLKRSIAAGGSYTFQEAIVDNWGQYVSGDYRFKVAVTGNTVSETYPSASAGVANFTVTDAQIAEGNVTVVVTPQKKVDGAWGISGVPSAITYVLIPQAQTNGKITLTSESASVASATATLVAGDGRTSQATVSNGTITIAGTVTDATTAVTKEGALVTVSGPSSILFTNGTVASYGSIKVYAAADGVFSVGAISNIAQKDAVITVSALGGSKTIKETFEPATATAGKFLTITAPATAQSGSTVSYSVVLTDKFGNVVRTGAGATGHGNETFKLSATGVGSSNAAVEAADVNGKATGATTTQAADAGTLTITASYDADSTDDTNAVVTATATVVVSDLAKAAADKAAAEKAAADAKAAAEKAAADAKAAAEKAAADAKAAAEKAAADAKAAAEKAAAELAAKAKTVTATAASSTSQTGRAVDVSVKVVNNAGTAGAGRTVNFTSTGAGSLTAYSAVTDANGVATVKLLAGAADNGDAVVTATVDGITATAGTVTFGTTDANVDIVNNRVTAVASYTKGKTVALYVDGIKVWSKASASDSDVVLNYNLKKGTHTVTVKISGGFSTVEKFIVK